MTASLPRVFARDLTFNPATCQVGDTTCPAATIVHEAVVRDTVHENGRIRRWTCDRVECVRMAQTLLDAYDPIDSDQWPATVAELSELTGLDFGLALGAVA